jgi:hypothetical protein
MRRRQTRVFRALIAVSYAVILPAAAMAQEPRWEVEVHGGGAFASNLTGGSTTLPTGSPLFSGDPRFPSRRVSTWFLGDGAALANAAAEQFAAGTPFVFDARIAALDSVLNRPLADRGNGGSIGFRLSRILTPRLAAEFNFDYAHAPLAATSNVSSALQSAATSFRNTFDGFLALFDAPQSPVTVTSRSVLRDGDGSQFAATGAINIHLRTQGRMIPYVTAGAGVVSDRGDSPSAELEGQYGFSIEGTPLMQEADRVHLAYVADRNAVVGVLGGGLRLLTGSRGGLRVDARVHLGSRTVRTLLDATPDVRIATPELTAALFTLTNPSVVFSNNPSLTNRSSSLSGQPLEAFELYEVSGMVQQVVVSVGYIFGF